MKKKVLITAALPYANGPLHFGHIAGAYLPADCYARFQRLQGHRVLYICGSDEHGVAITLTAEMEGRSPQEHVDKYHGVLQSFFQTLNISFDHYSRTTWEGHKKPTLEFFDDLMENGYMEARVTEQLYSEEDQRFLADRYVVGTCPRCHYEAARGDECPKCGASYEATDLKNPRSKLSQAPLTRRKTRHWFLRFDRFKDALEKWLAEKNWKPNVLNFVRNYLEDLRPRGVTRDSNWGIPVPLEEAEGKVFYVWFDAPIGYISASMDWAQSVGNPDLWKEYWYDSETHYVQFIGKDNIPFHALFFPAMVMGQNRPYKLVDELSANEFYNLEGRAFSKSDAWYLDLEDFFTHYTADQIRFSIAASAPENADSEFRWKDFQVHCNAELLGKYGNLVNRVLVFARKQGEGLFPPAPQTLASSFEEEDKAFLEEAKALSQKIRESYQQFKMRKASQQIMELASLGNAYFDGKQPWKDAKDASKQARLLVTLSCCLDCLKGVALVSSPLIPETAQKLWEMLGFKTPLSEQDWDGVLAQHVEANEKIPPPHILFKRLEDEQIQKELDKLQALC